MKFIKNTVIFFIIFFITILLEGLILSHFWSWFISSTFSNIKEITILEALGVIMVINFFKFNNLQKLNNDNNDDKINRYGYFIGILISKMLIYCLGWLLHYFMLIYN